MKLMSLPQLNNFYLVGGTALSLKFGHRISVDLDLFQQEKFEVETINKLLLKEFTTEFVNENLNIKFAIFCRINNVKVDFVHYPHNLIEEPEIMDGIRIYSNKDIAAMKINAILGRGVKKDFWDLYELLKRYSLEDIMNWHKQKYPSQQLLISIPNALIYFEDANESPDPLSLQGQTWDGVKKYLQLKVREYLS